ncbi:MAG: TlpA disulfide reductase family protein [Breznakibacter sp.]
MKKSTLLYMLGFGFLGACQSPASNFTINGEINITDGYVYFKKFQDRRFLTIDSAKISGGKFKLDGEVGQPDLYGLSLDRNDGSRPYFLFLQGGPVTVAIDTADKRNAKITGSAVHDLYVDYLAKRDQVEIDSFIKANPKSVVAAYALYRDFAYGLSAGELEQAVSWFDQSLLASPYIKQVKELIEIRKRVALGNKAIDFSAPSPNGDTVTLSDFYGNYLLLDFWASWCGPCRKENPNLVKAYRKFKEKGFNIVGVSLDKDRERWLSAVASDSLDWVHVSDLLFWDSKPAQLYGIRSIPSNFLLGADGTIIGQNLHGDELEKKLEELYARDNVVVK